MNITSEIKPPFLVSIFEIMAFCFQNCSDLLWEKKNVLVTKKMFGKFKYERREFAKCLRSQEQFIGIVKVGTSFETEHFLNLWSIRSDTYIGTIKMPIGTNNWDGENYRNKLENVFCLKSYWNNSILYS